MRKLVASVLSLALFTSILAGCGATSPNAVWQPRDIGESARAPSTGHIR